MSEQAPVSATITASTITPIHKDILVYDMFFGEQVTKAGLILLGDDKTDRGIHPRWARVYAVGPEDQSGLKAEEWVLIEHGRWSREMEVTDGTKTFIIRKVDPKCVLLKYDGELDPEKACLLGK
jgi:co-chaperonin GroES (HSP10)